MLNIDFMALVLSHRTSVRFHTCCTFKVIALQPLISPGSYCRGLFSYVLSYQYHFGTIIIYNTLLANGCWLGFSLFYRMRGALWTVDSKFDRRHFRGCIPHVFQSIIPPSYSFSFPPESKQGYFIPMDVFRMTFGNVSRKKRWSRIL